MKKVLMIALAALISVAFVSVVFAQAPAGTTEKKTTTTTTTPEKKETVTTTTTTKTKVMKFRGKVTNMDMTAKIMTVSGKKGDMTFDVSTAKMKVEPKAGDRVKVRYIEQDGKMVASWVHTKEAKKIKTKTTTTTKETKEEPAAK